MGLVFGVVIGLMVVVAGVRVVLVWRLPVGPESVSRVTPFDRGGTVATVGGAGMALSLVALGLELPVAVAASGFCVGLVSAIPYLVILDTGRLLVLQPPQLRWMQRNDVDFELPGDPDERALSESPGRDDQRRR